MMHMAQHEAEAHALQWTLADRLRKARESAGYTNISDFAGAMDMHRNTISAIERGDREPRRSVLALWAMATGTTVDYLQTGHTPGAGPDLDPDPVVAPRPKGQKYMLLTSGQVVDMSPLASLAVAN